jgi:hypothetical protein
MMRDAYVITVSDGTLLHCVARSFGDDYRPLSRRWSIQSTTTQYIGPKVQADRSPQAIRRLIDEWWTMKNAQPLTTRANASPGAPFNFRGGQLSAEQLRQD